MWLVRSKPDRKIYFTADSQEGAILWAATHMGFPHADRHAGSFPDCIFEFQAVRIQPYEKGEVPYDYTAYVDWELDEHEEAQFYHVVVVVTDTHHTVLEREFELT